jgi:hypothetical protein
MSAQTKGLLVGFVLGVAAYSVYQRAQAANTPSSK